MPVRGGQSRRSAAETAALQSQAAYLDALGDVCNQAAAASSRLADSIPCRTQRGSRVCGATTADQITAARRVWNNGYDRLSRDLVAIDRLSRDLVAIANHPDRPAQNTPAFGFTLAYKARLGDLPWGIQISQGVVSSVMRNAFNATSADREALLGLQRAFNRLRDQVRGLRDQINNQLRLDTMAADTTAALSRAQQEQQRRQQEFNAAQAVFVAASDALQRANADLRAAEQAVMRSGAVSGFAGLGAVLLRARQAPTLHASIPYPTLHASIPYNVSGTLTFDPTTVTPNRGN